MIAAHQGWVFVLKNDRRLLSPAFLKNGRCVLTLDILKDLRLFDWNIMAGL